MEGSVQNVVGYFRKGIDFVIPVYQRNYDWTIENCKKLMDDLVSLNDSDKDSHFFGSIVIKTSNHAEEIIIDGQQRITTLSLLFLAISKWLEENQGSEDVIFSAHQIRADFLLDEYKPLDKQIRLQSNPRDYEAYRNLFGDENSYIVASNITRNFQFIYSYIEEMDITITQLFNSIRKLEFMVISLGESDDPQLIFESLNSTGLELTNADKIRNYLLMNEELELQEKYYYKYWKPNEERTLFNLSEFFRMYLTIKNSKTPTLKNLYDEFKKYYEKNWEDKEQFFVDFDEYAYAYQQILGGPVEDEEIENTLYRLNKLDVTVTHPFIMAILRDMNNDKISGNEVNDILSVVESYVARRMIAQIPSNALNKIFATLYRDYKKHMQTTNAENFSPVDVITFILLSRENTGAFPTNEDIHQTLQTRDMYNINSKFRTYFFERLENYNHVENLNIYDGIAEKRYSIEHIMPQKLSPQWVEDLGKDSERIHEIYVHNLGNLTLTGYNPKMSNKSFQEKKHMEGGFDHSHFVNLNEVPARVEEWGEKEIVERRDELIQRILKVWPFPKTEYRFKRDVDDLYVFDGTQSFTNYKVKGYSFRTEEYHEVDSWIELYLRIIKQLTEENPSVVARIAELKQKTILESALSVEPRGEETTEIIPGIFAQTHFSNQDKMSIIKQLFDILDINYSELQIDATPPRA